MKNFVYGLLTGVSFWIVKMLFENANTSIADKPLSWLIYGLFPLLIFIFYLFEGGKNENTQKR